MTKEEAENLKPGTVIHGDFDDGKKYTVYASTIEDKDLKWASTKGGSIKHRWTYDCIKIFSLPESDAIINNYEIF